MPRRTNKKQEIIALLRRILAPNDCAVSESEMLVDAVTDEPSEVDIVMRCPIGDLETLTSFEVLGHARPAGRPWVNEQIQKHVHLPTEKLVLVSWSGFTKPALKVALAYPHVALVAAELDDSSGSARVRNLRSVGWELTPNVVRFIVEKPQEAGTVTVRVLADNRVFAESGEPVGNAMELVHTVFAQPAILSRIAETIQSQPEPGDVRSFVSAVDVTAIALPLHLKEKPSGELHRIVRIYADGAATVFDEPLDMMLAALGDVRFGFGVAPTEVGPALVVASMDQLGTLGPGAARVYDPESAMGKALTDELD